MNEYIPLRVEALMAGPILMQPHEALPLDGILEFAAFQSNADVVQRELIPKDKFGRQRLPPMAKQALNFKIPVKRIGHKNDPDWYWASSWAEFPDGFETDRSHWNRRNRFGDPSLDRWLDFQGKSEKVNISAGRYKGYHMPVSLVVTPRVRWWCLGDYEGVSKLLRRITHIGKKRSQGYGEVIRWSIHRADRDRSQWSDDGQPMRALPDRKGDYRRTTHGIRPPYWHHQVKRSVIVPPTRERT